MMTRTLVERVIDSTGIHYCAGENAALFLASVESEYLRALKSRAEWLVSQFAEYSEDQFAGQCSVSLIDGLRNFKQPSRAWGQLMSFGGFSAKAFSVSFSE